ncbi:MAG: coiled-coil domain-containing protein [Planctomycetota bacterium]|jgi:hypothetical protein
MGKGLLAIFILPLLIVPFTAAIATAQEETPRGDEAVRIDEILKEFRQAEKKVKATSQRVESVKKKQQDLLARIKKGEKVSEKEHWEVKEEFVNVLFEQYDAFNNLRSYEYEIIGALKRIEYKIRSQEKYLHSVITEIDELIDRYKRSLNVLRDKIKVEENVAGASSERVLALRRQKRTLEYMLKTYQRFGEYGSKVHVIHKKRQKDFGKRLKIFGEKLGQLPYIVHSLKNSLRVTHQIYQTSELFALPGLSPEVKTFIEEADKIGFGKDFEETLKVMSDMPEIFTASVPESPDVTPEEKKALEDEFKKIEKKYGR